MSHLTVRKFMQRNRRLPKQCGTCHWWKLCGGGCVRMRREMYAADDGSICSYGAFLEQNKQKIEACMQILGKQK